MASHGTKWECSPREWWDGGLAVSISTKRPFSAPSSLEILIKYNTLGAPMELWPEEDPNTGLSQHKDPEENKKLVEKKLGQQGLDRLKEMHAMNNTDAFNYNPVDQTKCPYASHMRKTGPRDDYPGYTKHVMMRRGIPYGPWCEADERTRGSTEHDRGLLFVSYQSSIDNGFRTQQKRRWFSLTLSAALF